LRPGSYHHLSHTGAVSTVTAITHQEAETDAAERNAILGGLARQLKKGDKALVSNAGYWFIPRM
jgi:hypothetical protein